MLQWGRNFIVAEMYRYITTIRFSSYTLQWGRNFIVAEIHRHRDWNPIRSDASMGPQLYRCGNFYTSFSSQSRRASFNGAATLSLRKYDPPHLTILLSETASMGPQLYRCGNHHHSCRRSRTWHRFNGAATLSLRKWGRDFPELYDKYLLQWGRNFIVAEIARIIRDE